MKFGITLSSLHHQAWRDAVVAADSLGFESVWLPEHLVLPVEMRGNLKPGEEHAPIDPDVPVFDVAAYLGFLAGLTSRIKLGTFIYLLGIRHPFVGARAFATIDVLSEGRAICGVGAGWLETEWEAVGLDPRTRGSRLDEAIDVARRLWTEDRVAHDGEHFTFDAVGFAPKPAQAEGVPIHIGGESQRALRRAAERGDGWLGMDHTPQSAAAMIKRLRVVCDEVARDTIPEITVMTLDTNPATIREFEDVGVDRLIVVPWSSSREAVAGLQRFANEHDLDA